MNPYIKIDNKDPHNSVEAWRENLKDAKLLMDDLYIKAVITGGDTYKVVFFDLYRKVKDIEDAIDEYFQGGV